MAPVAMLKWTTVASARVNGSEFVLSSHGDPATGEWVVRVDGRTLMSNRTYDSEIALADEALSRIDDPSSVLVGGLGLGYTLRAALDLVDDDASVTVAEIVPELVTWNRAHLGHLNDHPLDDPRCHVAVGDVFALLEKSTRTFDAILLDVDNGPEAISQAGNQRLYGERGVRVCHNALRPGGIVAVWSAGHDAKYQKRLERAAFDVEVVSVRARTGARAKHVLFLGTRRGR